MLIMYTFDTIKFSWIESLSQADASTACAWSFSSLKQLTDSEIADYANKYWFLPLGHGDDGLWHEILNSWDGLPVERSSAVITAIRYTRERCLKRAPVCR